MMQKMNKQKYIKIIDKYDVNRSNIELEIMESATIDKNIDVVK